VNTDETVVPALRPGRDGTRHGEVAMDSTFSAVVALVTYLLLHLLIRA
jgi:hypothetical protein